MYPRSIVRTNATPTRLSTLNSSPTKILDESYDGIVHCGYMQKKMNELSTKNTMHKSLDGFFGNQLVLIGCPARQGGYRRMAILEKVSCIETGEGSLHVFRPWITFVVQATLFVGLERLAVRCSFTKNCLVTGHSLALVFLSSFGGISMVWCYALRTYGDGSARNVQKWSVFQNTLKAHFPCGSCAVILEIFESDQFSCCL